MLHVVRRLRGDDAGMLDMSYRKNIMSVVGGETPPSPLFVPRLDIWYNRNKVRKTLPAGFETAGLRDICRSLGVGFHSVVPDFIRTAPEADIHHRALGFYNNPDFPYRVDFSAVDYEAQKDGRELKVIYHVDGVRIVTRCAFGDDLLASGASIPDIHEHAIKAPEDYTTLAKLFSKVRILPQPGGYEAYRARIGEDGLAVAFLALAAGPMHHIMRDLRKFEEFCLDQYDIPDQMEALCEVLAGLHERIIDSVLTTSAEVSLYGANYDAAITPPPFFSQHIAPWLRRASDRFHEHGKYLLTHTDGENQGLLPLFGECRFDIADSVCPFPMTRLPLSDYRAHFGDATTIWGGIPSTLMLAHTCSYEEFKVFVNEAIEVCRPCDHLILGIADTTPPDADFGRIRYLVDRCAKGKA